MRLKRRSVVFVGGGFTALAARQLTAKGVDVLVLERGYDRSQAVEAKLPSQRDELRWGVRGGLFQDWAVQTYSLHYAANETALPIRRVEAFLPGEARSSAQESSVELARRGLGRADLYSNSATNPAWLDQEQIDTGVSLARRPVQ